MAMATVRDKGIWRTADYYAPERVDTREQIARNHLHKALALLTQYNALCAELTRGRDKRVEPLIAELRALRRLAHS
jgi:hypothetical protein